MPTSPADTSTCPRSLVEPQESSFDVLAYFPASGWMGDAAGPRGQKFVSWNDGWVTNCHTEGETCVKITYTPGDTGWAGIYLQSPAGNWGTAPGRNMDGYRRITFWARSDSGAAVTFKAGGIYDPRLLCRDSFAVSKGTVALTQEWKSFSMDLTGRDLRSVIGGFAWIASKAANPRGVTFYLDDIMYVR